MNDWSDAPALRAFLARVSRRMAWIAGLRGAAAGLALAFLPAVFLVLRESGGTPSSAIAAIALTGLLGGLAGAAVALLRPRRVARTVERHAPECRNVIITATELMERPERVRPYVGARVCGEATRVAERLDPVVLCPAHRVLAGLAGIAALWIIAGFVASTRRPLQAGGEASLMESATIVGVEMTVTPPAYTDLPSRTLTDPSRIEVLAGSQVGLRVRAAAFAVTVETIDGRRDLVPGGTRVFAGEVTVNADGYIAVEPVAADGRSGVRRLIGLTVTHDQPPRVRVTTPGRDLFLPTAERPLDIVVEADDDLGIAALRLQYTRVSGSGEQFTFTDGEVPVAVRRTDEQSWTARGTLRLDRLGLVAGDVIVYRGVARDRRPAAPASESDAFVVEITSPGAVAAEGFALDDEQDRYGLSQQMIIQETERLIARAPSMSPESVAYQALILGARQRSVRAEFVFMMGGELAEEVEAAANLGDLHEEDHVEADDEAIAGRLANQGRVALIQAIRSMSRANAALTQADLDRALVEEKAALDFLQGAFARTRYILRALVERERLDLTRRLTGTLSAAARDVRAPGRAEADPRVSSLREALAAVASLRARVDDAVPAAVRASALAQRILGVDPSDEALQQVASRLSAAASALEAGRSTQAGSALDSATVLLATFIRRVLPDAARARPMLELDRLNGALTDALRRR